MTDPWENGIYLLIYPYKSTIHVGKHMPVPWMGMELQCRPWTLPNPPMETSAVLHYLLGYSLAGWETCGFRPCHVRIPKPLRWMLSRLGNFTDAVDEKMGSGQSHRKKNDDVLFEKVLAIDLCIIFVDFKWLIC